MRLLVRFLGFLFAAGTVVFLVGVAAAAGLIWHFSKDLPDYSQLQDYEPPVMNLVVEALATGAVASPQVIRHSKRMVARDFSGASFTAALRHKDAAYAVALADSLLPDVPVSRAALAAYDTAKAHAPDDDEGKMIEIVSRPK